jgi:nucleotide-binding universal stress UspA family protein
MKKSKADPQHPPIEDLQGQVYQHELGDPDRAEQIEHSLEEWQRKAAAKKRTRNRKERSIRQKTRAKGQLLQPHKHLLIAVDASEVSERAIAYVAEMMAARQDIRVLLLHVPRAVPPQLLEFGGRENPAEEKTAEADLEAARTDWIAREQQSTVPVFAHAKAKLREAGVPEEVVETQIVPWNPNESLEAAILEVAHERHCGTVVVGYAAFSWLHQLWHPHLADTLLQKAAGTAIWVVH